MSKIYFVSENFKEKETFFGIMGDTEDVIYFFVRDYHSFSYIKKHLSFLTGYSVDSSNRYTIIAQNIFKKSIIG